MVLLKCLDLEKSSKARGSEGANSPENLGPTEYEHQCNICSKTFKKVPELDMPKFYLQGCLSSGKVQLTLAAESRKLKLLEHLGGSLRRWNHQQIHN